MEDKKFQEEVQKTEKLKRLNQNNNNENLLREENLKQSLKAVASGLNNMKIENNQLENENQPLNGSVPTVSKIEFDIMSLAETNPNNELNNQKNILNLVEKDNSQFLISNNLDNNLIQENEEAALESLDKTMLETTQSLNQ